MAVTVELRPLLAAYVRERGTIPARITLHPADMATVMEGPSREITGDAPCFFCGVPLYESVEVPQGAPLLSARDVSVTRETDTFDSPSNLREEAVDAVLAVLEDTLRHGAFDVTLTDGRVIGSGGMLFPGLYKALRTAAHAQSGRSTIRDLEERLSREQILRDEMVRAEVQKRVARRAVDLAWTAYEDAGNVAYEVGRVLDLGKKCATALEKEFGVIEGVENHLITQTAARFVRAVEPIAQGLQEQRAALHKRYESLRRAAQGDGADPDDEE